MNEVRRGKVYNLCGGRPMKIREYTEMLIRFSGITNVVMEVVDPALWRPIDIMYQDDDASFIREELGWTPKIPIEKTIKDLSDYLLAEQVKGHTSRQHNQTIIHSAKQTGTTTTWLKPLNVVSP